MLNYEIDPAIAEPYLPRGTELDFCDGKTYASMVGFLFLSTRLLGLPVPFHSNFEEVNLRLYVRRVEEGLVKRGVVFVREIVPRWAIARTARAAYNENYISLPMSHRIEQDPLRVEYTWGSGPNPNRIAAQCTGDPIPLASGTLPWFIAEHYWGYAAQRDGGTLEYQVEHPPWRIWNTSECTLEAALEPLYGKQFVPVLSRQPQSAFVAAGSPVTVYHPSRLA